MTAKKLWQFAFLIIAGLIFFLPSCTTHLQLGGYQYTHFPTAAVAPQLFPVYVDQDFGEADKLDIAQALDQWNFVFNGHAKFVLVDTHFQAPSILPVVPEGAFFILKVTASNPLTQQADHVVGIEPNGTPHGYSLGFTYRVCDHHVYVVRDRLDNGDVFYIVMHELGHALCAEHSSDGLMYPHYSRERFQCVDQEAAEQVARAQGWPNDLNYCVPTVDKHAVSRSSGGEQQNWEPTIDIIGR